MSQGKVLFQGTWEEAIRQAENIPAETLVQVVEVAPVESQLSKEQFRAVIEKLTNKARMLDDEAKVSGVVATPSDDPYTQILVEKLRKQGLRFE